MSEMLNADFHEVWWIYAAERHPWGGIRLANFRKTMDGTLIVIISNEPRDRTGPRVWDEIVPREGWVKVKQIPFPTFVEVNAAVDAVFRDIVQKVKAEHGFET